MQNNGWFLLMWWFVLCIPVVLKVCLLCLLSLETKRMRVECGLQLFQDVPCKRLQERASEAVPYFNGLACMTYFKIHVPLGTDTSMCQSV